ncbi:MAG: DUF2975 domain-containing protein [Gemmiger sp.]
MPNNNRRLARPAFWNDRKSILLTKFFTLALLAASLVLLAAGPWIIEWLAVNRTYYSSRPMVRPMLYVVGYGCGAAAVTMLVQLYGFLRRVQAGEVFSAKNVSALRGISWCCLAAAALTLLAGSTLYLPYLFVCGAAGFMALIVRVVKNAFEQAVKMKDELDYTV